MSTGPETNPQPLEQVLFNEGLSYRAVSDLCPPEARVSEQTIADIATGRIRGKDKTRSKILNALNRWQHKQQTYTWDDLYDTPALNQGVVRRVVQKVLRRDLDAARGS